MAIQDQQQDFNEFDDLVDENEIQDTTEGDVVADEEFNSRLKSGKVRKKRQGLFNTLLILMILAGAGSAWLVFKPGTEAPAPAPVQQPVVAAEGDASIPATPTTDVATTAPTDATAASNALPPGITPQDSGLPAPVAPTEHALPVAVDNPPAVIPPADLQASSAAPAQQMVPQPVPAPIPAENGMTAEALPPPATSLAPVDAAPVAMPADNMMAPVSPDAAIAPVPVAPVADAVPPQAPVAIPGYAPQAATQPVAVEPTAPASAEMDLRLTRLEQQIQALSSDLSSARTALATAPASESASNAAALAEQIQALNAKLDRMAQQVDALDQRSTNLAADRAAVAGSNALTPVSDDADTMPAPKPAAKPVTKKPAAAKKAVVSQKWELRSAQPGVAWLGQMGKDEVVRFAVGDVVPGLGAVKAVDQEGGRWTVKAANGTLRQ
ncbi:MAG: hypothetical protein JWM96_1001 [Alphaproteobacteria bacterium]|nr:hypothetical protein [Alphaproteobacteria bacterium]